ncbi:MAG: MFS transporter [Burkholderiaceae bacterium]
MTDLPPDSSPPPERVPLRVWLLAWYGLAVLITASILAAVDRQILVLLAEPIRQSLDLSDTKLGLLQGAGIALFSGLAAVPLGWMADRFGRKWVLAGCVLVWTAATAACGMAWDFTSLFIAAIGLGIGEAGLAPVVYGLIPDMVPASRRVLANGIFALASILGAGLGIGLSGTMIGAIDTIRMVLPAALHDVDAWRLSFFAVAIPGPIVAALIVMIRLRPVPAVATDPARPEVPPQTVRVYLRRHAGTVAGVFGGSGLGGLGIQALAAWVPVLAARRFGASAQQVGEGIGAAYMIGTVGGALLGALGVKLLRPHAGVATPLRVLGIGTGMAAIVSACLPLAASAMHLYVLFGLQVVCLITATVVAPTLLQDMTPPALRSRVIALASVFTTLMGAMSPVLVGLVSDGLAAHANALGLAVALVASISMGLGALVTWRAERSFVRTVSELAGQDDPPPRVRPHTADTAPIARTSSPSPSHP